MTLRIKLIISFLMVSLITAATVGASAWWLFQHDFQQTVRDKAFHNFSEDVRAYIERYGSWDNAVDSEPFSRFVLERRQPDLLAPSSDRTSRNERPEFGPPPPRRPFPGQPPEFPPGPYPRPYPGPPPGGGYPGDSFGPSAGSANGSLPPPPPREQRPPPPVGAVPVDAHHPPFRFLLVRPDGVVIMGGGKYGPGQVVSDDVLKQGKAIRIDGKTRYYAIPFGDPVVAAEDHAYLAFFQRAITIGLGFAALVAVLLGLLLGSRLVGSLRELTRAIKEMKPSGEIRAMVPVRGRDEVGALAESFNEMSLRLFDAHSELLRSNETIRVQAEKLQELSLRDPLTGLHNRRYFDEQAPRLIQLAIRHGHPLCVMLADLDHFKTINDRYSHAVGDEVLQRCAAILQQNMRESDLLVRFGGEEFVAVFVESTLTQARERCESLRQGIESSDWSQIAEDLRVTLSIGLCDDLNLGSVEAMLQVADRCLYQAKEGGRNRIEPAVSRG